MHDIRNITDIRRQVFVVDKRFVRKNNHSQDVGGSLSDRSKKQRLFYLFV